MRARTVGELIASGYTMTLEEFLEIYTEPILIGVGILDVKLLSRKDRRHNTLALSLNPDSQGPSRHQLMGVLVPVRLPDGGPWKRLSLGRTPENDIAIDDPAVSEFHGFIKAKDDVLLLGDLGSTNGTKVNGEPLKPPQTHALHDEDIITFGRCSFQFFWPRSLFDYLSLGVG